MLVHALFIDQIYLHDVKECCNDDIYFVFEARADVSGDVFTRAAGQSQGGDAVFLARRGGAGHVSGRLQVRVLWLVL